MDVWDERKKFLDAPDSMLVGREDILEELERKLSSSDSDCKVVVCVVGEAGVGKTAVGKKLYRKMLNKFTSSAIVYVSNKPRFEELLLDIAKQVGLKEEKIKENLEVNLCFLLNVKKCLIFLDDIWSEEVCDKLKRVIPFHSRSSIPFHSRSSIPCKSRSRIIITSRNADVGRYIGGESSLIELRPLDEVKRWELFSKLIISSSENTNERFLSKELEDIARKILEICGGLPFAIEVAVGMLRQRRRTEVAWKVVLDSLSTSAENKCSKILSLSYEDLSLDLRPFLLYFGLFPKAQEISASQLAKAWVAENLIQVAGIQNPIDIGAAKLEILSDRNLIQVSKRKWNGRVKSCRIHDLLHVLCIDKAKENNFFFTCHNMHSNSFSTLRRLTIDNTSQYSFSNSKTPKLRSLLYFNNSGEVWSLIPNEIGNLSSLTYLKLSGKFKRMPSTIRYLKKLVTLDIQQALFYCDLPRTILRMKYLKHLLMLYTAKIANFLVGNKMYLPNIEILVGLNGDVLKASSLQKLSNLRKLRIRFVNEKFIDVIFGTTPISKKLQDLQLTSILQPVERLNMSHYDHLAKLYLHFVDSSPVKLETIEFLQTLSTLPLKTWYSLRIQ